MGSPNDKIEKVAKVISEALEAAIEAINPGVEAQEVDKVCRTVIEMAGMTFHVIPICMFFGEGAVGMSDSVLVTE